jgi:hypothetical protein
MLDGIASAHMAQRFGEGNSVNRNYLNSPAGFTPRVR